MMQKDEQCPTEQEWQIFFNENNMALACTGDFKQKLLKHPKVIEVYNDQIKQKGVNMTYEEREQEFLRELTNLSHKYKILIDGCGCCGSPYLENFEGKEKLNAKIDDPSRNPRFRFEDVYSDLVEYRCTDQLKFDKVKE